MQTKLKTTSGLAAGGSLPQRAWRRRCPLASPLTSHTHCDSPGPIPIPHRYRYLTDTRNPRPITDTLSLGWLPTYPCEVPTPGSALARGEPESLP